jgi:hypothetical protein
MEMIGEEGDCAGGAYDRPKKSAIGASKKKRGRRNELLESSRSKEITALIRPEGQDQKNRYNR